MKIFRALIAGFVLAKAGDASAAEPKSATPLGNPAEWVTTSDYPAQALREEWDGAVSFALDVDVAGRVKNCLITVSSGHDLLDVTACNLITQRAIFAPATDNRGRRVSGVYRNRVHWVIPGEKSDAGQADQWVLPEKVVVEVTFIAGADGKASDCKVLQSVGVPAIEGEKMCENAPRVGSTGDIPAARKVRVFFQVDSVPLK